MTEETVLKAKSKLSFVFFASVCIFSAFCLANTMAVLHGASLLNEIGAQCAYAAARQNTATSAEKSASIVIGYHKPDGLLVKEPISCRITEFRDKSTVQPSQTNISLPYARTETSLKVWIPALFLFAGALDKHLAEGDNSSIVNLSATHSSPDPKLDDQTPKSGRSSI